MNQSIFLSGYNDTNLQICKESKFLGWVQNSKRKILSEGDYVFIYNINTKKIESLFRVVSKSDNTELIWKDEKELNEIKYKHRWIADLISDKLNIERDELLKYHQFANDINRFNLFIRNPFPNFLDDKYDDLRSFLLTKIPIEVSGSADTNEKLNMNLDAKQYFLLQVNESGSKEILENNRYQHSNWTDTPRDSDHGKVKRGDLLLVYFARNSVQYKQSLKKIFIVNSVTGDNTTFSIKELRDLQGISLEDIRIAIEEGKISDSFKRLGQQGFNIKQIPESDYNAVLSLDNNPSRITEEYVDDNKRQLDIAEPNLWLVRAGDRGQGEEIALTRGLVGIGYDGLPGLHSIKDIKTFREHYINTHGRDSIGRVNAVVPQIWKFMNEIKIDDYVVLPLKTENSKIIAVGKIIGDYQYEDLNSEIKQFRPVKWIKKDIPRDAFDAEIAESFGNYGTVFHLGGTDTVNKIREMLSRLDMNDMGEIQLNKRDWLSLSESEIQDIIDKVLAADGKRLEIDPVAIRRIIFHLMLSKHVILVGPPGTGKSDLAMRLLRELGGRIIGKDEPIEAVASYEWGRYEVIGGRSLTENAVGDSFHFGCVTNAILQKKLLLIDEFNRADMNKAFGEMFLAIDHDNIQLREDEEPKGVTINPGNKISIPSEFRMICTMNDYDKSLLNDLSYGLLRRFAFVEISIPEDKEKIKSVVIERVKRDLQKLSDPQLDNGLSKIERQIDNLIDFMHSIKEKRQIGLSSYIDIVRYILFAVIVTRRDPWNLLNDALIDYALPQFDRLDVDTLREARKACASLFDGSNKFTGKNSQDFPGRLSEMISKLEEVSRLFENK